MSFLAQCSHLPFGKPPRSFGLLKVNWYVPKHILDAFPVGILPESAAKIRNNFQPNNGIDFSRNTE